MRQFVNGGTLGIYAETSISSVGKTALRSCTHSSWNPLDLSSYYSIAECHQYTKVEGLITLSTPKPGMHLLHIIISAPSTADMVFMNGRGLGCFYAWWSQDSISVVMHTGHPGLWTTQIGCAGNSMHSFQIQQDIHFLGQLCGNLCPTLWHHVDSSPHFLAFDWTPHSSIKTVVEDVDVEWHLNSYCLNSACPCNVKVMAGNYKCARSQTDSDVKHISTQIACHQPMFLHVFQGIFCGATSTKPFVVLVPVQDGVQGWPTLDHLDVNYWVKQYGLGVYTTACRQLRRTFDCVLHTPGALDGRYTVFFE
ncbi:hypothetical protein BD769DRAFT_1393358 [Suillus cothurnatus]|nr:hypothetical protein BD769DRAFT_1393358 [Suillus cothurnatus]